MLPNILLAGFGCRCTLSWWSQTTVNSDLRISFLGSDSQFQVQLWRGLFSFTCVILGWSTQKLLCQRCAFHWTAPRSGASADLTISCTLPSAGHEWRWWIKLISVPTFTCCSSKAHCAIPFSFPATAFSLKHRVPQQEPLWLIFYLAVTDATSLTLLSALATRYAWGFPVWKQSDIVKQQPTLSGDNTEPLRHLFWGYLVMYFPDHLFYKLSCSFTFWKSVLY